MKSKSVTRGLSISDWLCLGLLLTVMVLSGITVFHTSQNVLDSDAAAEMVLSHHLASEGKLLSQDWFYSTELRVFHVQLIFVTLLKFIPDWSLVRFIGTMFLQLLLLASYGYLIRKAELNRKVFFLGGSLLLLPVSVAYGRFVLYHAHYVIHGIVGFALTAWLLAMLRDWELRRKGWLIVHLLLFLLLSWLSSLNGYRQLATAHAPLALLCALWMWRAGNRYEGKRAFTMLAIVCAGMFFGLLGLIQNQKWQQVYSFADYSGIRLEIISPEGIMDMLFGLVHQFGYRRGLSVLSRMGLLSLLSIPVAFCCLARSVRSVLDRNLQVPVGERLILHMLPCALAVVGMIFVFTTQNVDAERYSIPYAIWYIPLLTCMMTASSGRESDCCKWLPEWMTAPRLVSFALWGICFCNGLCNMNSFLHPDGFNQEYTGLSLKNPDYVSYIDDVQEVLVANHYDLGYCCFEEGNVLTELSDGQLPVVNLLKVDTSQGFVCYDWLTLESSRSLPAQKPFLLLTWDLDEWINTTDLGPLIEKAYSVNGYIIYDIPDLQAFREALT